MKPGGRPQPQRRFAKHAVFPHDHYLVFVVRKPDAEPGIYIGPDVTRQQAAELLEMMAAKLREEA